MSALPRYFLSEDDYLALERESDIKHEFFQGEVLAMAGASPNHILIATTIASRLFFQLEKHPCFVYQGDLRLKVSALKFQAYPDVVVVCGEPKYTDDKPPALLNPTLIIEVLSPSTEQYDRGKKFQRYQTLESLQEYVLVTQDSPYIERFLRQANGAWLYTAAVGLEASIALLSIQCTLALNDVYTKIEFTSPPEP
jgi:Uma2 family endonuclease